MKSRFLLFVLSLFVFLNGSSQILWPKNTKPEEFDRLKASKIIVALMDTTDKAQVMADDYNRNIRFAMKEYWTYSKYEFAPIADVATLKDADVYVMIPSEVETTNLNAKQFNRDAYFTVGFVISIGRAEDLKVQKKLIGKDLSISLKKRVISATTGLESFISVITSVQQMQFWALYTTSTKEEKKQNNAKMLAAHKILRTTTLYIDKSLLNSKLSEAEIKTFYTYPCKIVSGADITEAIKNKKTDISFIQTYPWSAEKAYDFLVVKSCTDLDYRAGIAIDRGDNLGERKLKELNNLISKD